MVLCRHKIQRLHLVNGQANLFIHFNVISHHSNRQFPIEKVEQCCKCVVHSSYSHCHSRAHSSTCAKWNVLVMLAFVINISVFESFGVEFEWMIDLIQVMLKKQQHVKAVRHVCAFGLRDKFQPASLLKDLMKNAEEASKTLRKNINCQVEEKVKTLSLVILYQILCQFL